MNKDNNTELDPSKTVIEVLISLIFLIFLNKSGYMYQLLSESNYLNFFYS